MFVEVVTGLFSVAGERLQDGMSSRVSSEGLQSDARLLAVGGCQEAVLQADSP